MAPANVPSDSNSLVPVRVTPLEPTDNRPTPEANRPTNVLGDEERASTSSSSRRRHGHRPTAEFSATNGARRYCVMLREAKNVH